MNKKQKKLRSKGKSSIEKKSHTFYVEGMHCASCELLIEKKLLQLEGVERVDASIQNQTVEISTNKDIDLNLQKLTNHCKDLGYIFYNQKPKQQQEQIFVARGGQGEGVDINWDILKKKSEKLWVFGLVIIGFVIIEKLQLGRFMSSTGSNTVISMVLLGIIASVSSCAALIGGLILSLTKKWHEESIISGNDAKSSSKHIQFHVGRLISFAIGGALLGSFGSVLSFDNTKGFALLVIAVSLVMIILALQMLDISFAQKLRFTLPKGISKFVMSSGSQKGTSNAPALIGAGTFFLPCGFTLIAQAAALASGSAIIGSLMMVGFVIGTMPVLISISAFGLKMNTKPHLTAKFNFYAGVLVLLFALYNINGQLNVLGVFSANDVFSNSQNIQKQQLIKDVQGEQTISLIAKGFSYEATSSMTIEAGKSTKLMVDNQGIQGCGAYLAISGITKGYVSLDRGQNIIDLGKPKKGTYKITCSMGMVAPVRLTVK